METPKTNLLASLDALKDLDQGRRVHILRDILKKASREELLALAKSTESLSSPHESKFHVYCPVSPVATEFHKSSAMIRLLIGGNRASKTTTATVDGIILCTKVVPASLLGLLPQKKILPEPAFTRIIAADFPNGIEKIIKPKLYEWQPPEAITDYSAEFRIISWSNGSKTELMTYDQELLKHGGVARNRVQFDEEPPEEFFDEALMRIADFGGDIVIALTPVRGMTWVYDRLFLKASRRVYIEGEGNERGLRDISVPGGDKDIEVFILDMEDNHYLSAEVVNKILSQISDPAERKIRKSGAFVSFSGLVYKNYSSTAHDIEPFHIPDLQDYKESGKKTLPWPVYCALDPHPQIEHAYLLCAVDPYGRKFFFEEFFESLEIDELAARIKVVEEKRWVIWRLIDPLASQDDMVTRTNLKKELERRGLAFQTATKDRANGILRVREGFAFRDREGASGRVRMPEIYFFSDLTRTKWEIARYVWAEWRKVKDDKNPKATPKDKDDHMMENLYRIILREPIWIDYSSYDSPLAEWRNCP